MIKTIKKIKNKIFDKSLFLLVLKNKLLSRLTNENNCKIIMIIGYQRSGTTALLSSFSKEKDYTIYSESNYSLLMEKWLLRPEKEIRYLLNKEKKIITKPISESYVRTSGELFEEYKNYDCKYIFIVRNVENIYFSNTAHDPAYYQDDLAKFIDLYNKRMENTLSGLEKTDGLVVRYEDIIKNPEVYQKICDYFNFKGDYIFRKDSNLGRKKVYDKDITLLNDNTKEVNKRIALLVSESYKKINVLA